MVMPISHLTSKQYLKLMVAKSLNSWEVRSVFVVMNTLTYALRLSIENVSGSTRIPGTLNGNFS